MTSRQSAADTVAAHGEPPKEENHMGSSPTCNNAVIRRSAARRRGAPARRFRAVLLLLPTLSMVSATTAKAGTGLCDGMRIPLDTSVLSVPFANLALGGRNGNFLLDTGATHSRVDMQGYETPDGAKIFLSGFSLPGAHGGLFTATDLRSFAAPPGGQLGSVGTDFLSLQSIEFYYEQPRPFAVLSRKACNPTLLRDSGFAAVGVPGYYEADPAGLKRGMPNVPVIGLRIGTVAFPAQVDTGYGDDPQGAVQLNGALMRILRAAGIPMRARLSDVVTVGCSGTYAYERWQVDHDELSIIAPEGDVVVSYPPPLLEVKTDAHCGGIAAFAEPFAQIGASWLSRWGTSVFDGLTSAVWIPAAR
jgi:hypothetical protein